jgi:hypothetical protein
MLLCNFNRFTNGFAQIGKIYKFSFYFRIPSINKALSLGVK